MSTLIVLAAIAMYFTVGSIVGAKAALMFKKRSTDSYYSDYQFSGALVGFLWPLGVWLMIGARLLDRELARDKRREEAMKARERDMAERERLLEKARRELEELS